MSEAFPLKFYNVDNSRDPGQVAKEIRALLDGGPAVLGLCETNVDLPDVDGYRMIRDRSRAGRENVTAYVDGELDVSDVRWHDLSQTWSNTQRPGTHWPRSILEFRAGRLRVFVAHAPPKGTDNVERSQGEHVDKLAHRLTPWKYEGWSGDEQAAKASARVVLWDANRKPGEGDNGPDTLARKSGTYNAGAKIDLATYRGGDVKSCGNVSYFSSVAGVELKSDHGHAFRCELVLVDT